ncbi:hypothetical protein MTER_00210 [Mycolicibacter terrae]|uniref:Cysteine desulfurase n=1 Tax=Mycolicibacter terrae TaxID=1788 RepID=A0AAD1HU31_9MYCO|nr:hypothetical protein MTER_00210 [Mycolicibacter terrae]
MHFDAPTGMLIPDSVATTVSTAFRGSLATASGPHPAARRSAAVLVAARQAVADLVGGDPAGVVLGPDRAVLLNALADAASSRVSLGYETVVSRLDDEANIAPGCAPPTATAPSSNGPRWTSRPGSCRAGSGRT